ncbi:hypothetical protein [Aliiglaciecola sp. M165]|uniref:hypothetical protein n=1 Tax=Aliiglaciecola sp. M165 TaxID=2593649 RepID=UPI00117E370F|nr:hypothetical protein [Aliiglaciecola sp. M165]TRY30659.1 hypothetical protein FM019_12260 [Aliiglaciecola sp. M165]
MKNRNLIIVCLASLVVFGCSTLPIETALKDEHFRIENFQRNIDDPRESLFLMCSNNQLVNWHAAGQFPAGEYDLMVIAVSNKRFVPHSRKEAEVRFNVNLESGKNYTLNRKREGNDISVWIQDAESGKRVSDVQTTTMKLPLGNTYRRRLHECRTGTA